MDSVNRDNTMRVFTSGRMAPWELDHKAFINKEIQKMAIDDAPAAAALRKHYDEKLATYFLENPVANGVDASLEFFGNEQSESEDEKVNDESGDAAPKKRGRPAKTSSSN